MAGAAGHRLVLVAEGGSDDGEQSDQAGRSGRPAESDTSGTVVCLKLSILLAAAYGATAITLGAVLDGFSSWTAGSRTAEALDDIRGAGWFTAGPPR
jgi:hypothetical protein